MGSGLLWSLGLPVLVVVFLVGLGVNLLRDWLDNRKKNKQED